MDVTPEQAIDIIARTALAADSSSVEDAWENYPEIGEEDWEWVIQRAEELRVYPSDDEYREAYALLSARAEHEGKPND